VTFGTKVFVDSDVSVNQRFESILKHNYLSDVEQLNFADAQKSASTINKWVKELTQGRLSDLVSEDAVSQAVILLVNALYFEGTWRFGFNKTVTREFFTAPSKKFQKQYMEQTRNFYYFYSNHLNAKILRLPYNGRRFSMFIILPNAIDGLDDVVERLTADTIKNEVWHMDEVEVHAVIPKFKFDSSINLNDVVRALGITEIFENSATFPLLARGEGQANSLYF
jgi:serpin B